MSREVLQPRVISKEVPDGQVNASVTPRRRSPFVDVRFWSSRSDGIHYSDITVPKGFGRMSARIGLEFNVMMAKVRGLRRVSATS